MAKRKASQTSKIPVPKSFVAAEAQMKRIGVLERGITRKKLDTEAKIVRLKEELSKFEKPTKEHLENLREGLRCFCEANRDELTDNGKRKHAPFRTGKVHWRFSSRVSVSKAAEALKQLKKKGLLQFITVKESINKEEILKNKSLVEDIPNISIRREEFLSIEPYKYKEKGDD